MRRTCKERSPYSSLKYHPQRASRMHMPTQTQLPYILAAPYIFDLALPHWLMETKMT